MKTHSHLWLDIWDSTYSHRVSSGPVPCLSASIRRALDGPGTIEVSVPATHERALTDLQNRRIGEIYSDEGLNKRLLGAFIIDTVRFSDAGQKALSVSGPDTLAILATRLVRPRTSYSGLLLQSVMQDLLSRSFPDWLIEPMAGGSPDVGTISTRFDGQSVLRAFQEMMRNRRYHFRLKTGTRKTVEFGFFSTLSRFDTRIEAVESANRQVLNNGTLTLLERIEVIDESPDLINAILPYGAGEGDQALTLERSTRGRAVVESSSVAKRDHHWLENPDSIAAYGRIERRVNFKEIAPVTNSESDLIAAANALDDAAYVMLQRVSQPRSVYRLVCRRPNVTIRPLDTVRVAYRGSVIRDGALLETRHINGEFFVLTATETVTQDGIVLELEVSNVDVPVSDGATAVVGAVEAIEVNNITVKTFPSKNSFVYQRDFDSDTSAVIPIDITDSTLALTRCLIRLTTRPLRSPVYEAKARSTDNTVLGTLETSEDGGNTYLTNLAGGGLYNSGQVLGGTTPRTSSEQALSPHTHTVDISNHTHFIQILDHNHNVIVLPHTHEITINPHKHTIPATDLSYGVRDDIAVLPSGIRVRINGVDKTAELGGPWSNGGEIIDETIEISDILNAADTLQRRHTIEFMTDTGRGNLEATIELYETIQSIAVT